MAQNFTALKHLQNNACVRVSASYQNNVTTSKRHKLLHSPPLAHTSHPKEKVMLNFKEDSKKSQDKLKSLEIGHVSGILVINPNKIILLNSMHCVLYRPLWTESPNQIF